MSKKASEGEELSPEMNAASQAVVNQELKKHGK